MYLLIFVVQMKIWEEGGKITRHRCVEEINQMKKEAIVSKEALRRIEDDGVSIPS
jgi:hypothetical protein